MSLRLTASRRAREIEKCPFCICVCVLSGLVIIWQNHSWNCPSRWPATTVRVFVCFDHLFSVVGFCVTYAVDARCRPAAHIDHRHRTLNRNATRHRSVGWKQFCDVELVFFFILIRQSQRAIRSDVIKKHYAILVCARAPKIPPLMTVTG